MCVPPRERRQRALWDARPPAKLGLRAEVRDGSRVMEPMQKRSVPMLSSRFASSARSVAMKAHLHPPARAAPGEARERRGA